MKLFFPAFWMIFKMLLLSQTTRYSQGFLVDRAGRPSISALHLRPFSASREKVRVDNKAGFLSLLDDFRRILLSPEMATTGFKRSLQVSKAVANVAQAFILDRRQFLTSSGAISPPKTLRKIFEELGATYIKLGQFIASSPTVFPPDYVEEFQACLDRTPTVPFQTIRKVIEEDLGRPVNALFRRIDPVPLASASIAQVHRAVLSDGTQVVVKVRKPGVDSTLKVDLAFLLVASKLIEFIAPGVSSLSLANIVSDIRDSMLDELDFRKEAQNILNFREFLATNQIMVATAPKPYLTYSGSRVLTMEYLEGVPLIDLDRIKGIVSDPPSVLLSALRTWAATVASHDQFHADLHAGNLLVLSDGRIGFIDFGIVGKISESFRSAAKNLFNALVEDNYEGIAEALITMGATRRNVDKGKFGTELREVLEKIANMQPQVVITADQISGTMEAQLDVDERETTNLVLQIVQVAERNGLKLPREFGLIVKQALYFDRYQKLLAPEMDPLKDASVRSQWLIDDSEETVDPAENSRLPRSDRI